MQNESGIQLLMQLAGGVAQGIHKNPGFPTFLKVDQLRETDRESIFLNRFYKFLFSFCCY